MDLGFGRLFSPLVPAPVSLLLGPQWCEVPPSQIPTTLLHPISDGQKPPETVSQNENFLPEVAFVRHFVKARKK